MSGAHEGAADRLDQTMGLPLAPAAAGVVTIGVAVAVPEPHADELRECRRGFGDPLADAVPAHVTLLPPTSLPVHRVEDVVEHLERAAGTTAPFTMRLRGTGTFRPVSPVVFVQVAEGISACELLERAVRCGPLGRDVEFAYHPHVTVAHHVVPDALDRAFDELSEYEVVFPVDAFWLYRHGDDGVWRPDQRFALTGAPPVEETAREPLPPGEAP
ncbi:2'-5' RNA ligase family protein [uncultured Pseudokineococcus sp.]|uniref:2'-5' RNA ligase family protein n=1 Tax=uncultured Pseudokineococcus sp. TaxID=1642928 RepID=UPI00260A215F|nr:2'-5' RNA ligase family protein [uncultured Pseudokineococcus sp.]